MPIANYRKYSLGRHMTRRSISRISSRKKTSKRTRRKTNTVLPTIEKRSNITKGRHGIRTITMKEGTLLFHGHAEAKEWIVPHNRPAFFGGTLVALYYADKRPEFVSTYVLKKHARLLDLGEKTNFGRFYRTLKNDVEKWVFSRVTGYNLTELKTETCSYTRKKMTEIRFCTEDFISPEDKLVDDYAMLRFAKLICDHGYDGYYITPTFRRAYEKGSELLTEQIILCKPRDFVLKVAQMSISAVASNMRKRHKRKR